jgi:hypothetical protein
MGSIFQAVRKQHRFRTSSGVQQSGAKGGPSGAKATGKPESTTLDSTVDSTNTNSHRQVAVSL